MKRMGCVGKLATSGTGEDHSADIVGLFNDLRAMQGESSLRGVFLVHGHAFLQILEGEHQCIANAAYKIRRDARVEDCAILHVGDIDEAFFSHWKVKCFRPDSAEHRQFLARIRDEVLGAEVFQNELARKRFQALFPGALTDLVPATPANEVSSAPANANTISNTSTNTCTGAPANTSANTSAINNDLKQLSYSIHAWPKPGQMNLSPQIMRSCALLSRQHISYSELLSRGLWQSVSEFEAFLQQLMRLGVLVAHPMSSPAVASGTSIRSRAESHPLPQANARKVEGKVTSRIESTGESKIESTAGRMNTAETSRETAAARSDTTGSGRFGALMRRFISSARKAG